MDTPKPPHSKQVKISLLILSTIFVILIAYAGAIYTKHYFSGCRFKDLTVPENFQNTKIILTRDAILTKDKSYNNCTYVPNQIINTEGVGVTLPAQKESLTAGKVFLIRKMLLDISFELDDIKIGSSNIPSLILEDENHNLYQIALYQLGDKVLTKTPLFDYYLNGQKQEPLYSNYFGQ
jgi:hypothetical protein